VNFKISFIIDATNDICFFIMYIWFYQF
jgi:hypothetical protein